MNYLELTQAPAPARSPPADATICVEKPSVDDYLEVYRRVGEPLRWDQRLKMPHAELDRLLRSNRSHIYMLRERRGQCRVLGFCEFERCLPQIELKNFGLVRAAQGRGLGSWLLRSALNDEWQWQPRRIWLHTDEWDHPAALPVYKSAGFRIYQVRDEAPEDL